MPPPRDPIEAARSLRATILDNRNETENSRRLAPKIVGALIETELCRLAVPASLGGYEAAPRVAMEIFEELATVEASVAWIVWNNALPCYGSAVLANNAVRAEIFGDSTQLLANSTRPTGKARVVDGGFRVSGRWSLVSGCELATWIPVMCIVVDGDEPRESAPGIREARMAFLPKGSYEILDTWHVGGLRGTGSHDIVVDEVYVPSERTYSFADPIHLHRPLYQMPFGATLAAGCAAICVGIAEKAIETLLELGLSKVQIDPGPRLRDRSSVQTLVALSTAEIEAARLLLFGVVDDLWGITSQGDRVTDEQCSRLWRSVIHAARTARSIVTEMYTAAGTTALYVDSPLERAHRDIYAVGQHMILASAWLEQAGRVSFKLAPTHPLFSR